MLHNIVDHRTNTHDNEVDAVFESGWHDNYIDGATKAPKTNNSMSIVVSVFWVFMAVWACLLKSPYWNWNPLEKRDTLSSQSSGRDVGSSLCSLQHTSIELARPCQTTKK